MPWREPLQLLRAAAAARFACRTNRAGRAWFLLLPQRVLLAAPKMLVVSALWLSEGRHCSESLRSQASVSRLLPRRGCSAHAEGADFVGAPHVPIVLPNVRIQRLPKAVRWNEGLGVTARPRCNSGLANERTSVLLGREREEICMTLSVPEASMAVRKRLALGLARSATRRLRRPTD